jgi:glycerol-3-phosphate acyltransferase PlsY
MEEKRMGYLISILIAYPMGCVSLADMMARKNNIDAREHGTGNLGASNTMVLFGWGPAVLVAVHDVFKGFFAVLLTQWLFPELPYVGAWAGVACVIGHIFPFYLGFRGGKGLATFMGMAGALNFWLAVGMAVVLAVITVVTNFIALGTVTVSLLIPIFLGFLTGDWIQSLILGVATAVMLYKHWGNLVRIKNGTEIGLRGSEKYKVK